MLGEVTIHSSAFQAPSEPTFVDDISFELDDSYPAGGYPGLNAALAAAFVSNVYPTSGPSPRVVVEVLTAVDLSGYVIAWDAAAKKVRLFTSNGAAAAALAEVPAMTDLSAVTLRLRVLSR